MSRLLVALQFGFIGAMILRTDPSRLGFAFAALLATGFVVDVRALADESKPQAP